MNCKRDRKAVATLHFAVCGLQFPMKNVMLKVPNVETVVGTGSNRPFDSFFNF